MSECRLAIVFAVFPGLTQLSLTGPHEVLSRLPGGDVIVASVAGGERENGKLAFGGLRRLAEVPACGVICVPGGAGVFDYAMRDQMFLGEVRRLAATARLVTSVCTGSLVLGRPVCCAASAQRQTGHGGKCSHPLARSRIRHGWFATATSSPVAE